MRLLIKLALLILAARVLAGTPRGTSRDLDRIGDFSLRDIAVGINHALERAGSAVHGLWSEGGPSADSRPGPVAQPRAVASSR